jgi:hypothetical protein
MRENKMLSSLSIAAIAIVAAFVPCVAQAQANGHREDTSNLIATAGNDLAPSFNANKAVASDAGRRGLNPVVTANPRPTLSAESFKVPASTAVGDDTLSSGQQVDLFQVTSIDSRKSYRADDDLRIERSKRRIEFVPSMGLRMPYQN